MTTSIVSGSTSKVSTRVAASHSTTSPPATSAPFGKAPDGRYASPVRAEPAAPAEKARYGESVVRELLGASFIEEHDVAPRVVPQPRDD